VDPAIAAEPPVLDLDAVLNELPLGSNPVIRDTAAFY